MARLCLRLARGSEVVSPEASVCAALMLDAVNRLGSLLCLGAWESFTQLGKLGAIFFLAVGVLCGLQLLTSLSAFCPVGAFPACGLRSLAVFLASF